MDNRIKNILKAVGIFLIIYLLVFMCATASAQKLVRQGNKFIEQVDSSQQETVGKAQETNYIYVDKKGQAYNVWVSRNGKYFIVKVSKNGKKYRKYLPELTKELSKK